MWNVSYDGSTRPKGKVALIGLTRVAKGTDAVIVPDLVEARGPVQAGL